VQLQPPPSQEEVARAFRHRERVARRAVSLRRRRVLLPRAAAVVVLCLAIALPLAFRHRDSGSGPIGSTSIQTTTSGPGTTSPPPPTTTPRHTTTTSPQVTSSTTSTSTTPTSTTPTTTPPTTTVPATPVSETLRDVIAPGTIEQANYKVPAGKHFDLSSYSISDSTGAANTSGQWYLRVESARGSVLETLLVGSLATLVKAHGTTGSFSPPIIVGAGEEVALQGQCNTNQAACTVMAVISGTTSP
jgi:cytoskeletal protein RodZ